MVLEAGAVAAAVVTFLAPFTPFLLDTGKAIGTKFFEAVAEHGGEAAWQQAQRLWTKLMPSFSHDAKVQGIIDTVAADSADPDSLRLFAKTLARHLETTPTLMRDLTELLGGPHIVQEVIAERNSWIEDVLQSGAGNKTAALVMTVPSRA